MKKYLKILLTLFFIFVIITICTEVQAASASISSTNSATVGDKITITTTIKAAAWNLKVSGNGVKTTSYVDNTDNAENATITKTLQLDTSKAGTYTISLTGDVSDGTTGATSNVRDSVTITVKEKSGTTTPQNPPPVTTTKSGDATLKSITIGGKTYSGSSLKNTITYTVDAKTDSIKISAVKNNSKATISGTGTKSLVSGQTNKFPITVTAENGTKNTYNVNIIKLAEESTEPNIIEDDPVAQNLKLMLLSLEIKDVNLSPEFDPNVYTYSANVKDMKELEINAIANKTDAQIDIEGNTELKEGNNIVKITIILGEEKAEYIINVNNEVEKIIQNSEDNTTIDFKIDDIKKYLPLIVICLLGIISIRYIILSYSLSKKLEEYEEDEMLFEEDLEEDKPEEKENDDIIETKKVGRHF